MGSYNSGMGVFSTLITVGSLLMGAWLMMKGELSAADLVTFLLYINNSTEPVKKLVNFTEQFQNGYSGYERFLEIMSIAPDIKDKEDAQSLDRVKGEIQFEDVSFHRISLFSTVVFLPKRSSRDAALPVRLGENVEFHSSFSRLGRVRTAFGSALGLTKTLNFFLRFLASA